MAGVGASGGQDRCRGALRSAEKCRKARDSGGSRREVAVAPALRGVTRMVSGRLLVATVHLMAEPCLGCWEIRAAEHDQLVESSRAHQWVACLSRDEAQTAGREWWATLSAPRAPGARPGGCGRLPG
jgi:hypothetical protein